ncbi:hypothetical protein OMP38_08725 [Cohnella ginsengisoli]|uniref:Uncharacterized protein n=1 Tax=Cohnella ginsengisoli TaxID=425004 RepID=A0A9X4QLK6_9BACL|nr:hypothetical protein [Cohnella ginsengisoli]MDG0790939.1 hypothetical protein [Cohnella ginsengisoli]
MVKLTFSYPMMIPPFKIVEFSELTKKQAKEHFDWFVNEIPTRINILMGAIEFSGMKNIERFDKSPESLIILWEWLKKRIKTVPISEEEMDGLRSALPEWVLKDVSDWKLDTGTSTMAVDVYTLQRFF